MSKMKKKNMKQPTTRLRTVAASLMLIMPLTQAATDTSFSTRPLVGVSESFAPHVALALSVEFPTAGAAYSDTTTFSLDEKNPSYKDSYLGYFDNTKCYKYDHAGGYFKPSSVAVKEGIAVGLCNNAGETEEFSGNLMNFMTMTALDIFRSSMTGGNRAMGTGSATENYEKADTVTETFLRRAKVQDGQNSGANFKIVDRSIDYANLTATQKAMLYRFLPKSYTDIMMKDVYDTNSQLGPEGGDNLYDPSVFGRPRALGFQAVTHAKRSVYENNNPIATSEQFPNQPAGENDRFADNSLRFFNDGFTVQLVRRINLANKYNTGGGDRVSDFGLKGLPNGSRVISDGAYIQYYAAYKPTGVAGWDAQKWANPLNIVVKVCDPNAQGGVEVNCVQYGSNYKPEGLMQRYTKEKDMRFATFGYMNYGSNAIDGGVLRSRMKKLIKDTEPTKHADEWNQTTGILNVNPDEFDAKSSDVQNSGAINYLNKFGDASGYKQFDPAGELYYTALSYLMGENVGSAAYKTSIDTALNDTNNAAKYKDNFPVITDWDDPYKRGVDKNQYQCHQSSIILIGDTNTHADREIPGGYTTGDAVPNSTLLGNSTTKNYLERLLNAEGNPFNGSDNVGSSNSPALMAGLAYWARTNDMRPDITGVQNGNNFIVDVVEGGTYKNGRNAYYLAAKYGGFTRGDNKDDATVPFADKELPKARSTWTDDAEGNSSVRAFSNGVPRNYAIANNPNNMVTALEKAMQAGGALNNPSQAATGLSVNPGEILDFTGGKKPVTLQSTYNFAALVGDVVAYETSYKTPAKGEKVGDVLFETKEIWRASSSLNKFHGNTGYDLRKVFTRVGDRAVEFKANNAEAIFTGVNKGNWTAADLTNYALGDSSKETTNEMRQRSSLMGTVINSTVHPITPVKGNMSACKYADLNKAQNRGMFYAAASNNGMLHIFELKTIADGTDESGKAKFRYEGSERMAYMAGTALHKLADFAKTSYTHQFLNDGTPNVTEMCFGNEARSVLLGTTGRGGSAVYALDVTDLSNPSTSNVLWEFSNKDDSALGLTVASPVVTKAPNGKPLAIVSSGYNNINDEGHIFILDISKPSGTAWQHGVNYWKIRLGAAGVGAPFVYDGNQDGIGDKIFVGDVAGNMWQINYNDKEEAWKVPYGTTNSPKPLFQPTQASGKARPFTGAPYADMVNGKLMVVAATGQYFSERDLNTTQQNYAYGFIVDETRTDGAVLESNLLEQSVVQDVTSQTALANTNIKVYTVTEREMKPEHHGWRLTLLQGQNVAADALIRKHQVAEFTAVRMIDNISLTCERAGSTSYISVDVKNGGLNKKPIFDTNRDGQHNNDDKSVGVYEVGGMTTSQSTLMQVRLEDGTTKAAIRGTDGGITADVGLNKLDSEAGVRRISWREIF